MIVGDRVAGFDRAQASGRAGIEDQSFGKRGLAGALVGHHTDIANLFRRVNLHVIDILLKRLLTIFAYMTELFILYMNL